MIMHAIQIVALLHALLLACELRRLAEKTEWLEARLEALERMVSTRPAAPVVWPSQPSGLGRPPAPSLSRPSPASSLGRPGTVF